MCQKSTRYSCYSLFVLFVIRHSISFSSFFFFFLFFFCVCRSALCVLCLAAVFCVLPMRSTLYFWCTCGPHTHNTRTHVIQPGGRVIGAPMRFQRVDIDRTGRASFGAAGGALQWNHRCCADHHVLFEIRSQTLSILLDEAGSVGVVCVCGGRGACAARAWKGGLLRTESCVCGQQDVGESQGR